MKELLKYWSVFSRVITKIIVFCFFMAHSVDTRTMLTGWVATPGAKIMQPIWAQECQ